MRLGFVGLDTSHPASWIPIEREFGCEVVGFFDPAEIHPPEYAREFAKKWNLRIFDSIEQLADAVDTAVIHSCNWDRHVEQAAPFVAAGKAIFIDKPLAGNPRDINTFVSWQEAGTRITGGSCFFACQEILAFQEQLQISGESPHTLFGGVAVDDFNYAIHAFTMASAIFGQGIRRVRDLGRHIQRRVQIEWTDGRCAFLAVGGQTKWLQAHLTVVTEASAVQLRPGTNRLYENYVKESLAYLFGQTTGPRVPFSQVVECDRTALAAARSAEDRGRWVDITAVCDDLVKLDGAAFAAAYHTQKYPGGK